MAPEATTGESSSRAWPDYPRSGSCGLQDFFLRMHPSTLAYTFSSCCVALAGILYFSMLEARPMLHPWRIVILLSITIPVTTLLIARVALFRRCSAAAAGTPPPLSAARDS